MADCPKPTAKQLEFASWEFGVFLHFGIRTFYQDHVDWDGKTMSPQDFNPSELDCAQWVRTAREAGARYMVLTAKHHDGFNLWPSRCTDYSLAASPWRDGKGDVVGEFAGACHAAGMKVGLYYSPADWACPFYKDEAAYDEFFTKQLRELLSDYGQIDLLWFDGCGSTEHTYDWARIVGEIRAIQPAILMFNMGDPDYRWIGNEAGIAPVPCWNVVDAVPFSVETREADALPRPAWLPAECDCCIRHGAWFYRECEDDAVKTLDELMGLYYYSVGRGCNLLLNSGPDTRGLLPESDAARLLELGAEVRRCVGTPLPGKKSAPTPDGGGAIEFETPTPVDHAVIKEDLREGEHVRRFEIKVCTSHAGGAGVTIHQGFNVGHKAIVRFPVVKATSIRIEITEQDGPARLESFDAYNSTDLR